MSQTSCATGPTTPLISVLPAPTGATGPITIPIVTCPSCLLLTTQTAQLVQAIENSVGVGGLSVINIFCVCIDLMRIVETFSTLTGAQKKAMVIQALTTFVQSTGGDAELLAVIPSFIDAGIDLANGTLTLKEAEQVGTNCCSGICSSIAGKFSTPTK